MDLSMVVAGLDAVVFERSGGTHFIRRSDAPSWYGPIQSAEDAQQSLVLTDVFPFLEVFLPTAEMTWAVEDQSPRVSEFWTQTDETGQEIHLQATARRVDASSVLVIMRSEQMFAQAQLLLQRARELRQTYDALMREIERKDILLHTIVHDLTAPLHSVVGSLSLLQEIELPESARRWTEIAVEAAGRQRALIQTILSVFVSEHGGAESPDPGGIDLTEAVRRAVAEREPVARQRQVVFAVDLAGRQRVVADDVRLLRVLTNLLDNALRYSSPGTVVRITTLLEDGVVYLTVDDEGPGVAAEIVPRLFQKLGRDPRGGGSGLGLYFCRITVEQWGGTIGYDSRKTGGATFWIRLPRVREKVSLAQR